MTAGLEELAARVDEALAAVQRLPEDSRAPALELKDALDALHRAGLARIVTDLLADDRGRELLFALVDVPEVLTLLRLHGLVRSPDLAARTQAAFAEIVARGVRGRLVGVSGDAAVVRLDDATGCAAGSLRADVERALRTAVPALAEVRFEQPEAGQGFVPLEALTVRSGG